MHYELVFASAIKQQKTAILGKQLESQKNALRKVAHNILSPVAVLRSLINEVAELPEASRVLMRTAIYDISDTAHSISIDDASETISGDLNVAVSIICLLEEVISKKRVEYRRKSNLRLATNATDNYGLFVQASERELRSILSNLVNNAIESMPQGGDVRVLLSASSSQRCDVEVRDTGCGMAAEVLSEVCKEGYSYGKPDGTGFGLFHAKKFLDSWGAGLEVTSREGEGTSISLRLRRASPPPWFVCSLRVLPDTTFVVVDDNPAIHQLWARRLSSQPKADSKFQLLHLSSFDALRKWIEERLDKTAEVRFLIDLDLQDEFDGLDVIKQLSIFSQSILVTSYSNHSLVKSRCEKLGVGLLPKSAIAKVPIVWLPLTTARTSAKKYDAVLVDDDSMVRRLWEKTATDKGLSIITFATVEDFYSQMLSISKDTTLYIDSELGFGCRGEAEAKKMHDEYEYSTVILATGYPPSDFHDMPWLADVVSKDPPWQTSSFFKSAHIKG